MSFLRLNNIAIPVAAGSASRSVDEVGDRSRAASGSMRVSRRALKDSYAGSTVPKAAETAEVYRDLILGLGHRWSFDSHLYSSKGLGPADTHGTVTAETSGVSGGRFPYDGVNGGVLRLANPGDYIEYRPTTDDSAAWTVMVSREESSVWVNYILSSAQAGGWVDGVLDPLLDTSAWLVVSVVTDRANSILITNESSNSDFDELVFLPFAIPSSWPIDIHDLAWSDLPKLRAEGDWIRRGSAQVYGRVDDVGLIQAQVSGALDNNLQAIEFTLEQA